MIRMHSTEWYSHSSHSGNRRIIDVPVFNTSHFIIIDLLMDQLFSFLYLSEGYHLTIIIQIQEYGAIRNL